MQGFVSDFSVGRFQVLTSEIRRLLTPTYDSSTRMREEGEEVGGTSACGYTWRETSMCLRTADDGQGGAMAVTCLRAYSRTSGLPWSGDGSCRLERRGSPEWAAATGTENTSFHLRRPSRMVSPTSRPLPHHRPHPRLRSSPPFPPLTIRVERSVPRSLSLSPSGCCESRFSFFLRICRINVLIFLPVSL